MIKHLFKTCLVIGYLFVSIAGVHSYSQAETISLEELKERAYFEQFVNPGLTQQPTNKSLQLIDIPHYEIPKRLLVSHSISEVDSRQAEALEFTRNGEVWVRWIPALGDTFYTEKIEQFLKKEGIPAQQKKRFKGYRSASRSLFVVDPVTGFIFSTKSATNNTPGVWSNKPYSVSEAITALTISEYINSVKAKHPQMFSNIGVQTESQMYGIEGLDVAMSIRQLKARPGGRKMIPLFSFSDEKFGREFALANSKQQEIDPLSAHIKLVLSPWAYQVGRFAGLTGLASNSQHGQNSYIEVDENLRPTGYVELRDTSDARLMSAIAKLHGRQDIVEAWQRHEQQLGDALAVHEKTIKINIAPHHGIVTPNWMREFPISRTLLEINPVGSFLSGADQANPIARPGAIIIGLYGAVYKGLEEIVGAGNLVDNRSSNGELSSGKFSEQTDGRVASTAVKVFEVVDPQLIKNQFKKQQVRSCKSFFIIK